MRIMNGLLVSLVVSVVAMPAFAGYNPGFDGGVNVNLAIQAAIEAASSAGGLVPAVPGRVDFEQPVWVSVEKGDVEALDEALFKSAPLAQNQRIAIYKFAPSELGRLADGMHRAMRRAPGFFAYDTLEAALEDLKTPPEPQARARQQVPGPRQARSLSAQPARAAESPRCRTRQSHSGRA